MKHMQAVVTVYDTDAEANAGTPSRVMFYKSVVEEATGIADKKQSYATHLDSGKVAEDIQLKASIASLEAVADRIKQEDPQAASLAAADAKALDA